MRRARGHNRSSPEQSTNPAKHSSPTHVDSTADEATPDGMPARSGSAYTPTHRRPPLWDAVPACHNEAVQLLRAAVHWHLMQRWALPKERNLVSQPCSRYVGLQCLVGSKSSDRPVRCGHVPCSAATAQLAAIFSCVQACADKGRLSPGTHRPRLTTGQHGVHDTTKAVHVLRVVPNGKGQGMSGGQTTAGDASMQVMQGPAHFFQVRVAETA